MERQTMNRSLIAASFCGGLVAISNAMGAPNLLGNPSFELGNGSNAFSWGNFSDGTTERTQVYHHDGSWSFRFTGGRYVEFPHTTNGIAATPGVTYDVSMWAMHSSNDPLDGQHSADCKAIFYDSSGNELGFTESYFLRSNDPVNTWKRCSYSLTAPVKATALVIQIGVAAGAAGFSGSTVYFDDGNVSVQQPSLTLVPVNGRTADLTITGSTSGSYGPAGLSFPATNVGSKVISFVPANTGPVLVALDLVGSTVDVANLVANLLAQGLNISTNVDPAFGVGFDAMVTFAPSAAAPVVPTNQFELSFANFGNVTLQGIGVVPEPTEGGVAVGVVGLLLARRRK